MSATHKVTLHLSRACGQRTNPVTTREQIDWIINRRALGGARGAGWNYEISDILTSRTEDDKLWLFKADVTLGKTGKVKPEQIRDIINFAKVACIAQKFNKYPWSLVCDDLEFSKAELESATEGEERDYFTDICLDRANHFDHIYGREAHVDIMLSSLRAAVSSEFNNRFHCVLYGSPGCGKTELLIALGNMLGAENEAYLKLDATSTTEAGIQKLLLDAPSIPPVIIIEEIEKVINEKSLNWLLAILDQRAEIRKTNYRIGHQARNVKMLGFATVNDMDKFKSMAYGALADRFVNELYCPRPDEEILRKILTRDIAKVEGDLAWIDPTIEFCRELKIDHPRKVRSICLCGMGDLLTGKYQETYKKTMKASLMK